MVVDLVPENGPEFFMVVGVAKVVLACDNFLALDVVGFIKLEFALGVVRRALTGLEGVRVIVADEVILIGLDRAVMLGVDVVGFMTLLEKPFLVKSCWLKKKKKTQLITKYVTMYAGKNKKQANFLKAFQ